MSNGRSQPGRLRGAFELTFTALAWLLAFNTVAFIIGKAISLFWTAGPPAADAPAGSGSSLADQLVLFARWYTSSWLTLQLALAAAATMLALGVWWVRSKQERP